MPGYLATLASIGAPPTGEEAGFGVPERSVIEQQSGLGRDLEGLHADVRDTLS